MKLKNPSLIITYLVIIVSIIIIAVGVFAYYNQNLQPGSTACTEEAKLCPDGSAVGRTGPNCEFAPCPTVKPKPTPVPIPIPTPIPTPNPVACTQEAKLCPDGSYVSRTGPNCEFSACPVTGSTSGNLCSGPGDLSCGPGYQCIQDCGGPVVREGDPIPPYHCLTDALASQPRMCPICLASNVLIDTPSGPILVTKVTKGMKVWSKDLNGNKISSNVTEVIKTPVPSTHQVVHLILADKREVWVSGNHPLANGQVVGTLKAGDVYDDSNVKVAELVQYWDSFTYDLLPDSATGEYWVNGILLGSTLAK